MVKPKHHRKPVAGHSGRGGEVASLLAVLGKHREQLDESLRVAQELIEVLPVPVFFKGRDGKYLGVNKAWEDFFGVPRETFVGKEVHDLYPQSPQVADKHYAMDQELWRRPGSQSYEIPVTTRDGRVRHTLYYKATFARADGEVAGLIGTIIDITERTQAARRRAMEHAVTQVLAESATVDEAMPLILKTICQGLEWACGAYWKWDETTELLHCAQTWHVDAEGVAEFIAATKERPNEAPAWKGAAPGTVTGGVVRRVWFSGAPAWFRDVMQQPDFRRGPAAAGAGLHSAFGFPILSGAQPLGVMEFYSRDIRQPDEALLQMVRAIGSQIGQFIARKQAETALREAHDALARKALELTRSNAELEQFAYVASHDLQEPLRMISSYTQLLLRRYGDRLDSEAKEFMDFVVDGATRMKQLIEDLLTYSRVGTRGKEFQPAECEGVLMKALANLRAAIESSGATVTHDPLPTVDGDEVQLVQLLQNLIGNALKFKGAETPRIHVGVAQQADDWEFAVRDNGIGIDPQYFERIFMVFQRLHGKGKYPGTGIGLAICKKVVDRHGGRIRVESQPGHGATFYFTLPRKGGNTHG